MNTCPLPDLNLCLAFFFCGLLMKKWGEDKRLISALGFFFFFFPFCTIVHLFLWKIMSYNINCRELVLHECACENFFKDFRHLWMQGKF